MSATGAAWLEKAMVGLIQRCRRGARDILSRTRRGSLSRHAPAAAAGIGRSSSGARNNNFPRSCLCISLHSTAVSGSHLVFRPVVRAF